MSTNEDRILIGQIQTYGKFITKNHLNEDIYVWKDLLIKISPDGSVKGTVLERGEHDTEES